MELNQYSKEELASLKKELQTQFESFASAGLGLDLTRGKPATAQLALSDGLDGVLGGDFKLEDGTDARNYGVILGIPEARRFGAELLEVRPEEVLVGGNSSLNLMYQWINFAHRHGVSGPESAWEAEAASTGRPVRFLCPVPGYDRHFTICQFLGIEMVNVPFTDAGPDMDRIEALVKEDPLIKGIWCVPKYSNPTGHTYSDDTVRRMAALPASAGKGFSIMWDNAYTVHHLSDQPDRLLGLMEECRREGTEDNVTITSSTSKVTFAGAGISFLATSERNIKAFEKHLSVSTIGQDKVNQLRHVRFLKDQAHLAEHMRKHAEIVRPKFERAIEIMNGTLGNSGMGSWSRPNGGYFISFESLPGLARRIVELAGEAGVKLTPAGATYPYGVDELDTNIRIAPTFPSMDDLDQAMRVFVLCVQLASVDQRLEELG